MHKCAACAGTGYATPDGRAGALHIEFGAIPCRKSKAICVREGSVVRPVAYFRDDESFRLWLMAVAGGASFSLVSEDDDA
jgi:hypothetical protein